MNALCFTKPYAGLLINTYNSKAKNTIKQSEKNSFLKREILFWFTSFSTRAFMLECWIVVYKTKIEEFYPQYKIQNHILKNLEKTLSETPMII
jgi:hypothetical protein